MSLIGHKNIKTNIFRKQANNSIMCGYFYIGLIDFMFAGKILIDYGSLFLPDDFEKKMTVRFLVILKMREATNTYLNDETLFRLNKINKIEDYKN